MSLIKTLQKRTIPQASDSELVDEKMYPLCPSQKAETAVPEYEQNDWEQLSKTKGNLKDGTPSNHLENAVSREFRIPFGHR